MKDLYGMNIIQSMALPGNETVLLNSSALTIDAVKQARADLLGPPEHYSRSLVPEGHIPKIQLKEFWWMDKKFICEQNNKLINLFGTKPNKFIPRVRYDTAILPYSAVTILRRFNWLN